MNDFELLEDLLLRDRSVRRFDPSVKIELSDLRKIIGLTRFCASGRNAQPLRYRLVTSPDECSAIFPSLGWAGYYKDWDGPSPENRPAAYIIQCVDTSIGSKLCDDGLQLQVITLGAVALGLSACIIKSFNAEVIRHELKIGPRYSPLYVVALGKAAEKVRIVPMKQDGDFRYYRDENDVQCVPKRELDDLII